MMKLEFLVILASSALILVNTQDSLSLADDTGSGDVALVELSTNQSSTDLSGIIQEEGMTEVNTSLLTDSEISKTKSSETPMKISESFVTAIVIQGDQTTEYVDDVTTTPITTTRNVCEGTVCENGGSCVADDGDNASCLCMPDYVGPRCSVKKPGIPSCEEDLFSSVTSNTAVLNMSMVQDIANTTYLKIDLVPINRENLENITFKFSINRNKYKFKNLTSSTKYHISITSQLKIGGMDVMSEPGCQNISFSTLPTDINCDDILITHLSSTSISLDLPSAVQSDGITDYKVNVKSENTAKKTFVPVDHENFTLDSLLPDSMYTIHIKGAYRENDRVKLLTRSRCTLSKYTLLCEECTEGNAHSFRRVAIFGFGVFFCNVKGVYCHSNKTAKTKVSDPSLNCSAVTVEAKTYRVAVTLSSTRASKLRIILVSPDSNKTVNRNITSSDSYQVAVNPGTRYNLSVSVLGIGGLWSQNPCLHTVDTRPSFPDCRNISSVATNTSLTLNLEAMRSPGANFYRIEQFSTSMSNVKTTENDAIEIFSDLYPGSQYTFRITSVSLSSVESDSACFYNASTRPNVPNCSKDIFKRLSSKTISIDLSRIEAAGASNYNIDVTGDEVKNKTQYFNSSGLLRVKGLEPGTNYTFRFIAISSDGAESKGGCSISYRTRPARPGMITIRNLGNNSISIKWVASRGSVDKYKVLPECQCIPDCSFIDILTPSTEVKLSSVPPGSTCNVTVQAVSGILSSQAKTIIGYETDQTAPSEVRFLRVDKNITKDSAIVTWVSPQSPNGEIQFYRVKVNGADRIPMIYNVRVTKEQSLNSSYDKVLGDLLPGTCYSVIVRAKNNAGMGPPMQVSFYTDETVPSAVEAFTVSHPNFDTITIDWAEPIQRNGIITDYTILLRQLSPDGCLKSPPSQCIRKINLNCRDCVNDCSNDTDEMVPEENLASSTECLNQNTYFFYRENMTFTAVLDSLSPWTKYRIEVFASTVVGDGPSLNKTFQTRELEPSPVRNLTVIRLTSDSATLRFRTPGCPNGNITMYKLHYSFREHDRKVCCMNISRARIVNSTLNVSMQNQSTSTHNSTVTISVPGLHAYWSYSFRVVAVNNIGTSDTSPPVEKRTRPAVPDRVDIFNVTSSSPYRINVAWKGPCFPNGIIKRYIITVIHPRGNISTIQYPGNVTSGVIGELRPDSKYKVHIVAENGAGRGKDITELDITTPTGVPHKPPAPEGYSLNATAISVTWSQPALRTGPTHYTVEAIDKRTNKQISTCTANGFNASQCVLSGLEEFWNYTVKVTAHTANGSNTSDASGLIQTKQAAPGQITNLTILPQRIASAPRQVNITWDPPSERERNGIIRGYNLKYRITEETDESKITNIASTSVRNLDLIPETEYIFQVQAVTIEAGIYSNPKRVTVEAGAPALHVITSSQPLVQAGPASMVTDKEKQVSITLNTLTLCDSTYGRPNSWGIVVAESSLANGDAFRGSKMTFDTLKDTKYNIWSGIRDSDTVNPYIASDSWRPQCNIDGRVKRSILQRPITTTFLIGADGECQNSRKICNGFLKPGKEYRVRVWVCTNGGCAESPYSEVIKTEQSSQVAIFVSIPLVIIIVGTLVCLIIIMKKRRMGPFRERYDNDDVFQNETGMELKRASVRRPVKREAFADHVQSMHQDSNLQFSKEFKLIKDTCAKHSTLAAEAQAARIKNRYTNILPYDHSRVKLLPMDDEDGSDYINANYMPGFNSKREYIASQGPLPCTKDDFWRMVWEQGVTVIVMLTQCIERGRRKCECYWPETCKEPVYFGDLIVEMESESTLPDYVLRVISIVVGTKKRIVKQFHFLKWPDMGCPETTWLLLNFAQSIRLYVPHEEPGPIVVHCSAGVGRTGTFIVVDHLMQHVQQENKVDVYGLVMALRNNRPTMVQTEDQYVFIHDCIRDFISSRDEDEEAQDGGIDLIYQNV